MERFLGLVVERFLGFLAECFLVVVEAFLAFGVESSVVIVPGASPAAAAAARGTPVYRRIIKPATQRRTTNQNDDLVTAASTFRARVTTNRTFMNGVDVCGAGSRQIPQQHRGVREFSALVGFDARAAGAGREQDRRRDAPEQALKCHGWNVRTMPLKFVALPCTVVALGPLVKVSKWLGPVLFESVTSK